MKHKQRTRILLVVGLAAAIVLAIVYQDRVDAPALEAWFRAHGAIAPLLFMLVYALATVLFLPGTILTLVGGVVFGPLWGTFYNLTGATLGATLAFLIARYLASDWIRQRTGQRVEQLIKGVEGEGWRFVAFVRLVPLFPFNLVNYALGMTRIRLLHYVIATYVFMSPGAVAYTYLGYAGREAVAGGGDTITKGLLALALLAVVAFLPRFISRLRRGPMMETQALRQQLEGGADILVLDVRGPEEFSGEHGHIAGAKNIPVEELPQRVGELAACLERSIAIICRTDRRSSKAALLLARQGFSDVQIVRGGMLKWNAEGLPVVR